MLLNQFRLFCYHFPDTVRRLIFKNILPFFDNFILTFKIICDIIHIKKKQIAFYGGIFMKRLTFAVIVWSLLLICNLGCCIFFGSLTFTSVIFTSAMIIFSITQMKRNKKYGKEPYYPLSLLFLYLFFTLPLKSYTISYINASYPFQYYNARKYITGLESKIAVMPETLPEYTENFKFEFFPGMLQGPPAKQMIFTTDRQSIDEIIKDAESRALCILDYAEYCKDSHNANVQNFEKYYYNSETNNKLHISTGSFDKYSDSGEIYVISTDGEWNHPDSECIIINREKCLVNYTVLG